MAIVRGRGTATDQRQTIVVEFGPLNDWQRTFVDLHSLRAVGTDLPRIDSDGVLIEFWIREGDTAETAYDDIRGWAIGNSIPIRGVHGSDDPLGRWARPTP